MYGRVTSVGNQKWMVGRIVWPEAGLLEQCGRPLGVELHRRHAGGDVLGPLARLGDERVRDGSHVLHRSGR